MEFSTICRVCMQQISLEYIDLDTPFNETTYFECFNFCTKLEAKASDKLPKTICLSCANLLQMAYDFINAAAEADRLFHECFAELNTEYDDTEFNIEENGILSKEIIVLSTLSEQNETFVSETTPTTYMELIDGDNNEKYDETCNNHLNAEESAESIQNEDLQENAAQLTINTEAQTDVNLQNELEKKEEEEDPFAPEIPIFETIESLEVEKLKEDAVQLIRNTKTQNDVKQYRFILPKINEERKDSKEIIVTEKVTDSVLIEPNEENQQSDKLPEALTLNKDTKPKIKCRVCKKKIRKNYADHMNEHTGNKAYKCDTCDDSFFTLKQFKLHKAKIHKKFRDAWFCNKCGEAFESGAMLNTHQDNDHSNKTSGLCLTCGNSFSDQDALEQHVKDEHWSRRRPVECTHCQKKYQLNTLPMHVKYAHLDVVHASESKEFTCKYCFHHFEGPTELEEHIKTHKGKHVYTCATCGQDFKGKRVFEHHKAAMHHVPNEDPTIRKCNKCDFTTTEMCLLIKHKKKHYNYHYERIPKYLCAYCPKKFFNIKPLNDHEDYQHGEQKSAHKCDLCDKKFYSNFKLQTHKKSAHGNDRPFMCQECPKAFKLRSQLLQHEKYHYGRKIDCPHCEKKFVQPCYLRVHLRTHTNELPFECHLCNKKFAIKVRLTYHLAKHEGIVRNCEYCSKAFDNMAKLRIHRFQHTGYPYVCDVCQDNHHKRISFIRHMRRNHAIIMTNADVEDNRLRNMENIYRNPKVEADPDLEI